MKQPSTRRPMPRAALMGFVSAHRTMANDRMRRRVAFEAARLLFAQAETQYDRARRRAVRRLCMGDVLTDDLPSDGEIRHRLREMKTADLLTQEHLLGDETAQDMLGDEPRLAEQLADRFRVYEMLLTPLESVMQSPEEHPEGDVLYHSLQVFELARGRLPYDEEFLLAALLHDVGKGIDRHDHVTAGLLALDGAITPRTAWLIEHHVEALALRADTLGVRLRRRLEQAESYDELVLLADCDRQGRQRGLCVPDVHEALAYVRDLSDACENGL